MMTPRRDRFSNCTIFQGSETFLRWTLKDVPLRNTSNECSSKIQPNKLLHRQPNRNPTTDTTNFVITITSATTTIDVVDTLHSGDVLVLAKSALLRIF